MTLPPLMPPLLAGVIAVTGTSAAVYLALIAEESPFRRFLGDYEDRLDQHTSFLLFHYRGSQIARLQVIASSVLLALSLVMQTVSFASLALLTAVVPPLVLWKQHAARVSKLERQLDTWLLMLANALKATPSVGEAIASTVSLVPHPFSEEVDLVVKEMRLGAPLHRAVNAMARRINSTVISGALATIVVARQTGGDLSQTLQRSAAALRERARLEGVLRAKTAEGRGQVLILAAIPFVLCIVIGSLDRTWFDPMLNHAYGRTILVGCSALWTIASLWAHRIVRVDV